MNHRSRSIDKLGQQQKPLSPINNHHQHIHSLLVHKIHHLLQLPLQQQQQQQQPSQPGHSQTFSISSHHSSSNCLNTTLIDSNSSSLNSLDSSKPIPAITLSSQPSSSTITGSPLDNHLMSSLPQSLSQFRSSFKSSKSPVPLNTNSHRPSSIRPAPLKLPPPSVGPPIHPDSWVHSDDSDVDSAEPLSSKHRTLEDDDQVPLSQLRNKLTIAQSSPTKPDPSSPAQHTTNISKVLKRYCSSRSLRSLCKRSSDLPSSMASPSQSGHPPSASSFTGPHHQTPVHRGSPQQAPPLPTTTRTLRPAISSPNLSRRACHPPSTPSSAGPALAFHPCPPLPSSPSVAGPPSTHPNNHYLFPFPSPSEFPTPPSSISPPTRSLKLSSTQSSVSARSSERDIYRRMRRRHKEEMSYLYGSNPTNNILDLNSPINGYLPSTPIDPSLYNMLNDTQRHALRQRSEILSQNLKAHLEAFAYEMIQSNLQHHQHQQQVYTYGVGAY